MFRSDCGWGALFLRIGIKKTSDCFLSLYVHIPQNERERNKFESKFGILSNNLRELLIELGRGKL